jgi:hypothetical protein
LFIFLRYEEQRAAAIDAEEQADEEFVRSIFSKNGDVKVSNKLPVLFKLKGKASD